VADVTKEEDIERLVKTTINTFERIDILVNNAVIANSSTITDPDYMEKYSI